MSYFSQISGGQIRVSGNVVVSGQVQLLGTTDGTAVVGLRADASTNALKAVSYEHSEIHGGSHYFIAQSEVLASGAARYFKFVTPDSTSWVHFTWNILSNGVSEVNLYEAASGGMTSGVAVVPRNNNRNNSDSSVFSITKGVLPPSGWSTELVSHLVGGESFKSSTGGETNRDRELVLKQNTVYCGKIYSRSADNYISYDIDWYEHSDIT